MMSCLIEPRPAGSGPITNSKCATHIRGPFSEYALALSMAGFIPAVRFCHIGRIPSSVLERNFSLRRVNDATHVLGLIPNRVDPYLL